MGESIINISMRQMLGVLIVILSLPFAIMCGPVLLSLIKVFNKDNNFLYSFSISVFPAGVQIVSYLISLLFPMLIGVGLLLFNKLGKLLKAGFILIFCYIAIFLYVTFTSYGHIDERGITYRSPYTYFTKQQILWSEFEAVTLRVKYQRGFRTSYWHYNCYLDINTDKPLGPITIGFYEEEERKVLVHILDILKQKNVKLAIDIDAETLARLAKESSMEEIYKQIEIRKTGG